MLKLSKEANYKKSQEEKAGTEQLQERGFWSVRGRTTLRKEIFSKFPSVGCKGSSENQVIYKGSEKPVCPLV